MISKLIFGTANFSRNYGSARNQKNQSKKNIIKILNYLKKNKIYNLDTSIEYTNVDKKIKFSKYKNWKIITKINLERFQHYKSEDKILTKLILLLEKNAKNAGVKNIEVLLLHNSNIMFTKNGDRYFSILKKLKHLKKIKKFGYSIYDFNTIDRLVKNFKPDILQCPYNIFDQRLNNNKLTGLLRKKKIEIHVRSVFLQGLLLLKIKNLPSKFSKWKNNFIKLDNWTKTHNYSKLEVCLNFIIHNKLIDKIVFGAEDLNQMKQILSLDLDKKIKLPKNMSVCDESLINPLKWKE